MADRTIPFDRAQQLSFSLDSIGEQPMPIDRLEMLADALETYWQTNRPPVAGQASATLGHSLRYYVRDIVFGCPAGQLRAGLYLVTYTCHLTTRQTLGREEFVRQAEISWLEPVRQCSRLFRRTAPFG